MVTAHKDSSEKDGVQIRSRKSEKPDNKMTSSENDNRISNNIINANTKAFSSDNGVVTKEGNPKSCFAKLWTLFKYGLLVLALPTFLNFAALNREEKELMPNDGSLIAISKVQNLFMKCKGSGSPLVLLDAPTGLTSDTWRHIFSQTAAMTEVCAFDRAGLGFSDRPRKPTSTDAKKGEAHTTEQMVEDMISLLKESDYNGRDIVLVGAGVGSTNAQFLAQLNHLNIVGVVLLNPFHSTLFQKPKDNAFSRYWHHSKVSFWQMLHVASAAGLTRIAIQFSLFEVSKQSLPDEMQWRQKFLHCKPGHVSSVVEEHYHVNQSLVQLSTLSKIHKFPKEIPVSLTSTENFDSKASPEINAVWQRSIKSIVSQLPPLTSHNVISITDDNGLFEESSSEIYHAIIEMVGEYKLKENKVKSKKM